MHAIDVMLATLQGDAEITGILPGGVWDRPINPNDDEMRDVVWQEHPLTGIRVLQPCAVLLPPQEVDSPVSLNPGRRLDTDLWPELVFYAERMHLSVLDAADERAMELLHGLRVGTADIAATGYRARPLDADELPGDVWTTLRRYRVQMSRHIAGE